MKKFNLLILSLFTLLFLFSTSQVYSQQWVLAGTVNNPGVRPSVSIVDYNTAWISDGNLDTPKVFRTTNGGINWNTLPTTGISNEIYCIWASSSSNAFVGEGVVNGGANLLVTTNSGQTWTITATTGNNEGYFNGIVFSRIDPNYGFAIAVKVFKTSNAGQNWVQILSGVNGVSNAHNSLFLVDRYFYGFGMNKGASRIHLTTNDGVSWNNQNVGLTGSNTSAISFNDDKLNGVAATSLSLPTIARTSNGGITWTNQTLNINVSGDCKVKYVTGSGVVYLLANNGKIVRSLDNGATWTEMYTAGVTGLYHFDFTRISNIIYGYAVSTDGSVIRLADTIALTGVGNSNSIIPLEYQLYENYPNPFNPITMIKFDLPNNSNVTILVYDLLGREVNKILSNEFKKGGSYNVRFDGSNLSSGVYFYKITATSISGYTGNYISTKKMVILK